MKFPGSAGRIFYDSVPGNCLYFQASLTIMIIIFGLNLMGQEFDIL